MSIRSQKYTLLLPVEIHENLKEKADKYNVSMKDIVRQCLRFGLLAMEIDEDPNADIFFREQIPSADESGRPTFETRETRVKLLF